MSTHAQETDTRVALGAKGELPGIYLDAWGGSRRRDPSGRLGRRPAAPRVPLGPPPPPWGNDMPSASASGLINPNLTLTLSVMIGRLMA